MGTENLGGPEIRIVNETIEDRETKVIVDQAEVQDAIRKKRTILPFIEQALQSKIGLLEKQGLQNPRIAQQQYIEFDPLCRIVFVDCIDAETQEETKHAIYGNFEDNSIVFRFMGLEDDVILTVDLPYSERAENLEAVSEAVKVVKSRPPWMYPELFNLPKEEIWLRGENAKTLVVGDPYETCDKEGVTIVEYEFGDEILPHYFEFGITSRGNSEEIRESVQSWFEDLWREDLRAVSRESLGEYFSTEGNPYSLFIQRCITIMQDLAEASALSPHIAAEKDRQDEMFKTAKLEIKNITILLQKLTSGLWSMDDAYGLIGVETAQELEPSEEESVRHFFSHKQALLNDLGSPEAWKAYSENWDIVLESCRSQFPENDHVNNLVNRLEKTLKELVGAKTGARVNKLYGLVTKDLFDLYPYIEEVKQDSQVGESKDVRGFSLTSAITDIVYAKSKGAMDYGDFGGGLPGEVISSRTRKSLKKALVAVTGSLKYMDFVLPRLDQIDDWLEAPGEGSFALPDESKIAVLQSHEKELVRAVVHQRQSTRAVSLHGFFPYRMPELDPQDRILALTSVSMHGWNDLKKDGFREDIEESLPFLKIGGKYILGPVNQDLYFGAPSSGFPYEDFTSALQELKNRGLIEYKFVKVKPDEARSGVTKYSDDSEVLLEDEAAHSLVITRLK